MTRNTVKLLLSVLCLTTACDPLAKVPQQMRGHSEEIVPDSEAAPESCPGCFKWSAKPPHGVNGPPWSSR